mmetsp:Transcript_34611/g.89866  ORF Transcript_34611/g.89866 Transcript_34611/m.89866 type:complete len:531 (-) Transcript_34611:464-2056(-)
MLAVRARIGAPVALLFLAACLTSAEVLHRDAEQALREKKLSLNLLVVSLPMSPMHSVVAIAQEMCLRGHNVTVVSLGEEGRAKVKKYSPGCALRYIAAAPMPLNKTEMAAVLGGRIAKTNSTFGQMSIASRELFAPLGGALQEGVARLLDEGVVTPDYALVSLPVGSIAPKLAELGVEFAVNLPSMLLPPVSPYPAAWVPIAFLDISVHDRRLLPRLAVRLTWHAMRLVRYAASAAGVIPPAMSDMDPAMLRDKLMLVNSIPGLDYPQPLPPLVQYTGPIVSLASDRMESFPPEVEAWLSNLPPDKPVVYVSYGTVAVLSPEQVAHMAAELTSEEFATLWALPKEQQTGLPDPLPPLMMVGGWIPTPRALAHPAVSAFVSHCGGNSVAEAMAAGVPIVGYPQFGDQPAVCRRVADAGAGVTAPAKQSWLRRADVLAVLGNEGFATRATQLAGLFAAFGGATKAADLLEAGARGGLALMVPPTEESFLSWLLLEGYDLAVLAGLAAFGAGYLAAHCCRRRPKSQPSKAKAA